MVFSTHTCRLSGGGAHTHTHKAREKRKKKKKTRKKAIYEWKQPWPSTVTASEDARQLLLTINKDKKRTNRVGREQDSARVLVKKKKDTTQTQGGREGSKVPIYMPTRAHNRWSMAKSARYEETHVKQANKTRRKKRTDDGGSQKSNNRSTSPSPHPS